MNVDFGIDGLNDYDLDRASHKKEECMFSAGLSQSFCCIGNSRIMEYILKQDL